MTLESPRVELSSLLQSLAENRKSSSFHFLICEVKKDTPTPGVAVRIGLLGCAGGGAYRSNSGLQFR